MSCCRVYNYLQQLNTTIMIYYYPYAVIQATDFVLQLSYNVNVQNYRKQCRIKIMCY